ncbi:TIM barrel protein [soil metagenome]
MREYGAGIWLFGQFVDRYASDAYGPPVTTVEAIEKAASVDGLRWLDINYPFNSPDESVADVAAALERTGLGAIAITPHIYMRRFQLGSFTNPDPAVRQAAVDLCKTGIEVAHQIYAHYLKFWPGQDGYDYPFQVDHARLWDHQLEGVRTVVEADPDLQFAIEYKLKEPRGHMAFSTAARTLLGIEEIGAPNLGIVLDMGHSLFAKETPADVLQLIHRRGRLVSVEVNDNLREWDDDMVVGSVHPVETLEFLWGLRQIGWDRPVLLDQFPFREDPVGAARLSIRAIEGMERILDRLDPVALGNAQDRHDALAAQALVLAELVGAKG